MVRWKPIQRPGDCPTCEPVLHQKVIYSVGKVRGRADNLTCIFPEWSGLIANPIEFELQPLEPRIKVLQGFLDDPDCSACNVLAAILALLHL
jgi:hypothetical protein